MGFDADQLGPRATAGRCRLRSSAAVAALVLLLVNGCGGGKAQPPAVQPTPPSASGQAGPVLVKEAWIPAPTGPDYPAGSGVVVMLLMRNFSKTWDRLSSCSTPVAPRVGLSQLGIAQDFITVPTIPEQGDGIAELFGITRPLSPGERVPVTLHFSSAGSLTLQVPVRPHLSGRGNV